MLFKIIVTLHELAKNRSAISEAGKSARKAGFKKACKQQPSKLLRSDESKWYVKLEPERSKEPPRRRSHANTNPYPSNMDYVSFL